jgi:hypothetical protein
MRALAYRAQLRSIIFDYLSVILSLTSYFLTDLLYIFLTLSMACQFFFFDVNCNVVFYAYSCFNFFSLFLL